MPDNKNVFSVGSIPSMNYSVDRMSSQISTEAKVSPDLIHKVAEEVLSEWQEQSGMPVKNLFILDSDKRNSELDKILASFEIHIRPLIPSQKRLNKAMEIAHKSMEIALDLAR